MNQAKKYKIIETAKKLIYINIKKMLLMFYNINFYNI